MFGDDDKPKGTLQTCDACGWSRFRKHEGECVDACPLCGSDKITNVEAPGTNSH